MFIFKLLFLGIIILEDIQIVGMSATIGNIDELATFLKAYVFKKNFRPVELKEYIKLKDTIYKIDWTANSIEDKTILERKVNYGVRVLFKFFIFKI